MDTLDTKLVEMHTANMEAHERTQEEQARQRKLLNAVYENTEIVKAIAGDIKLQIVETRQVLLHAVDYRLFATTPKPKATANTAIAIAKSPMDAFEGAKVACLRPVDHESEP